VQSSAVQAAGGQHSNTVQFINMQQCRGKGTSTWKIMPLRKHCSCCSGVEGSHPSPVTHPAQFALHALICLNHCCVLLPIRHHLRQARRSAWQGTPGGRGLFETMQASYAMKCRDANAWEMRQAGVTGGGGPSITAQHALPNNQPSTWAPPWHI
jgi:hypothetical protein